MIALCALVKRYQCLTKKKNGIYTYSLKIYADMPLTIHYTQTTSACRAVDKIYSYVCIFGIFSCPFILSKHPQILRGICISATPLPQPWVNALGTGALFWKEHRAQNTRKRRGISDLERRSRTSHLQMSPTIAMRLALRVTDMDLSQRYGRIYIAASMDRHI